MNLRTALRVQAARKMVDLVCNVRRPSSLDLAAALLPVSERALVMTADIVMRREERRVS